MACCALGVSRGTWCVFSKKRCPACSGCGSLTNARGGLQGGRSRKISPSQISLVLPVSHPLVSHLSDLDLGQPGKSPCGRPRECGRAGRLAKRVAYSGLSQSLTRGRTRAASGDSHSACGRKIGRCGPESTCGPDRTEARLPPRRESTPPDQSWAASCAPAARP